MTAIPGIPVKRPKRLEWRRCEVCFEGYPVKHYRHPSRNPQRTCGGRCGAILREREQKEAGIVLVPMQDILSKSRKGIATNNAQYR